ncbi:hypothetical protein AOQ84DRAFT_305410 [Glonium stellatum]|uniref:NADH dehydrogenase [ubiquinone] 1 alpha subcomplex assembly factor 3 n=1 Tax=Glonium stellatum TaxID=574774 RepID=A0A8E2JLS1_9PEZI|nr:hypothetical protein AOQ84DRAFT_305410 [Glonium stellatum]
MLHSQTRPQSRQQSTGPFCQFHTSSRDFARPQKSRDRGPKSTEDTQTDFEALDVLGNTPAPTTGIDACTPEGFALNNGLRLSGSGILLVGGEAFRWRPWVREGSKESTNSEGGVGNERGFSGRGGLKNSKGQWEVQKEAWGVLDLVWPKPDLLIIGTGPSVMPVSPTTRKHINDLGIRLEIQDTRNAAAQFNLLATERGVQQVAAALIPMGWEEGN